MAREDHVNLPDDVEEMLRGAMSAEPSPAFLPSVRERIAAERPAPIWTRTLAVLGAATAAIVVAVFLNGTERQAVAPPEPHRPFVQADAPAASTLKIAKPRAERPPVPVRRAVVRAERIDDLPPVIVDQRQREALDGMLEMVRRGQLTEDAFAQTVPQSLEPIADLVPDITVAPVAVSPIVVDGVLQIGPEEKQPPRPADAGLRP